MNNILHIYTRVSSTIQQEEGTSLEAQKQVGFKKAIELRFDKRLWNEGGQSSFHDDLNNRPVLVSLLNQIESGSVKHLFVYNTDRLSRNQQTWAVIRYKLLKHGVTLHSASGQMKLKNPVDDLMLGILSEISQYDNRIRAERSRLGRYHKVQLGNWKGGSPPFGYRLMNRRLEVDPFESECIRKIYEWYCHQVPVKEIQSRLSRQGVMTRRGNAKWSLGSIQLILRNPVYVGHFDYTDKMLGETVRIATPPIIDHHLFKIAQEKRKASRSNRHLVNASKHFYLLRGVLNCGHCGLPMGGRTHKAGHQHVYYCVYKERRWKTEEDPHPKWKRGTGCSMTRSINIDRTDQLVWNMVKEVLNQIRDRQPMQCDRTDLDLNNHNDQDELLIDGVTWISADQIEMLSNEEKKVVIRDMTSKITVHFDRETKKHRVDVMFSEHVARQLANPSINQDSLAIEAMTDEITAAPVAFNAKSALEKRAVKKLEGSRTNTAAEHA